MSSRSSRWPSRIAFGAAACALVAAIVAALGPANETRALYTWPPSEIPAAAPDIGWYALLPLLNRVPDSIEVAVPCGLSPPLRQGSKATVVATVRRPERTPALVVALNAGRVSVEVDRLELVSLPWPESCPLRFAVEDGELRLGSRTEQLDTQTLGDMPIVTGLFSGLDLRKGESPDIAIRTRAYATSWTARQTVAALVALALACLAFLTLTPAWRHRAGLATVRKLVRTAWCSRRPVDAVVLGALAVWWIVGPLYSDDGWLAVESRMLTDLGNVSIYYDVWGVDAPFGFWLTWLGHWFIGSTGSLMLMRLPALFALVAMWFLCRWCLRSTLKEGPTAFDLWVLAGAFLLGATAWGMTLRPEPFVALLTLAALASLISFTNRPRPAALAIAMFAAVLAVTAHPVGIVCVAPILAAFPAIIRAVRRGGGIVLIGILSIAVALGLVLSTLDADLGMRLAGLHAFDANPGHSVSRWHEYERYLRFDQYGATSVLRRLSLALMLLTVVALLTRLRGVRTGVMLLPARSLFVGLALLALIPSKWPWHFGSLIGLAAVASCGEITRLLREGHLGKLGAFRGSIALILLTGAGLWGWIARGDWGVLDLWLTGWSDGFNLMSWLGVLLALMAFTALLARARGVRVLSSRGLPLLAAPAMVVTLSFAAVGITGSVLVIDAIRSPWTLARQNVEALAGRDGCGVLDEIEGGALSARFGQPSTRTLIVPYVALYFPCSTTPEVDAGVLETPDFVVMLRGDRWLVDDLDAPFGFISDLAVLRLVASLPEGVDAYSADLDDIPYTLLPWERAFGST